MSEPIAAVRLKSFVERIERLREEKAAITADERDIFSEAKGVGFDTKAMRKVLQRRAMDPSALDELDSLIELYEGALGGKGVAAEALRTGATIREAAKAGGVSVGAAATLSRVQKTQEIERPEPAAAVAPIPAQNVAPPGDVPAAAGPAEPSVFAKALLSPTAAALLAKADPQVRDLVERTAKLAETDIQGAYAVVQAAKALAGNDDGMTIPADLRRARA